MAAILNVWRHIKNPTPSVDAYLGLLEEQSCQISPQNDLKQRTRRAFVTSVPHQQEQEQDE